MRMYVKLDVEWPGNRKRIRAGLAGGGLHAICMCLAKRSHRDGWVARDELYLYGADDDLIDLLVSLEMLDVDGEWVRPHDWLEENLSSEAIRREKSDKARAANHARWHAGPFEDCDRCQEKARSSEPDPNGLPTDPDGLPEDPSKAAGPASVQQQQQPSTDPPSRRALLEAAAEIIGQRAADRPTTRNPTTTKAAVKAAVIADRYQDAYAWIIDNPGADADELAEFLEPTPIATVHPLDTISNAQRAATERTRRELDGEACPLCNDHGLVLNDDGLAVRCTHGGTPVVNGTGEGA